MQSQIESSTIELSDDEQYAVNQYVKSESYKINEALRKEIKLNALQEKIKNNLDKALEKMSDYEGNIVRTLQIDNSAELKRFINSLEVGKSYSPKEYLSFSNKSGYNLNANVKMYVENSRKGKDIRQYNRDESEILYKRNSKFRVLNKKFKDGTYYVLLEELDE